MLRKRLLGFTVTNDFGAYASCRAAPNVFSSVAKIPVGIKSVPTNASPMKCVLVQWRGLSGNRKVMSDQDEQGGRRGSDGRNEQANGKRGRGNLFIGLGWALLGLLGVDQLFQYQQQQERERLYRELQDEADTKKTTPPAWLNQDESNRNGQNLHDFIPCMYQSKVIRIQLQSQATLPIQCQMTFPVLS